MYKEKILKLKEKGKTHNEIVDILGCSKSTVSFHCQNNGIKSKIKKISSQEIIEMNEFYKTHTLKETSKKYHISITTVKVYCDRKKENKLSVEEKSKRRVIAVQKRRDKVKKMAVEYKGGCCQNPNCGYKRYYGALEFHHKDPNEKDFSISQRGYTQSWNKVINELDKCIMVCSVCHREIHANILDPITFEYTD